MLEQVKILTSRRAYEFGADTIRLSMLSIQPIQQQIQQLFGFQSSAIGSPLPTFGAVPATYPQELFSIWGRGYIKRKTLYLFGFFILNRIALLLMSQAQQ